MGRSADIKTKPVATRVPMADYIKILQESSAKGISVSDYVSSKLVSNDVKLEKGGDLGTTTIKEVDKKETIEKIKNLQKELSEQKNKALVLEKEISALKSNKTVNMHTLELLGKLFKMNLNSYAVIDGRKNPYFDLVNEIQQEFIKD
jgi:phenylalanyl-tRNA synthetase alpha subunit